MSSPTTPVPSVIQPTEAIFYSLSILNYFIMLCCFMSGLIIGGMATKFELFKSSFLLFILVLSIPLIAMKFFSYNIPFIHLKLEEH
jgi:hypothetical protein